MVIPSGVTSAHPFATMSQFFPLLGDLDILSLKGKNHGMEAIVPALSPLPTHLYPCAQMPDPWAAQCRSCFLRAQGADPLDTPSSSFGPLPRAGCCPPPQSWPWDTGGRMEAGTEDPANPCTAHPWAPGMRYQTRRWQMRSSWRYCRTRPTFAASSPSPSTCASSTTAQGMTSETCCFPATSGGRSAAPRTSRW